MEIAVTATPSPKPVLESTRNEAIHGDAVFSADGRYRYWLERRWDDALPQFTYVLLNPSKAGVADNGDRTVPKLVTLTTTNGGGGFELVNLFAVLDTRQVGLHLPDAVGAVTDENDRWVRSAIGRSATLVLGWGDGNADDGASRGRQAAVRQRAREVWSMVSGREAQCFRVIASGAPGFPGRLAGSSPIVPYRPTPGYP
jgi:hypothetical protein